MTPYQRVRNLNASHIDILEERKCNTGPPPHNMFKINVDTSISNKNHRACLGAVVRNSFGKVVIAGFYQSPFNGSVSFAKAEAV